MFKRDGVTWSLYIRWCRCLRAAGGRKQPLTSSLLLSRHIISCWQHVRIKPSRYWAGAAAERPPAASICCSTWSPSQPAVERCTQVRNKMRTSKNIVALLYTATVNMKQHGLLFSVFASCTLKPFKGLFPPQNKNICNKKKKIVLVIFVLQLNIYFS